MRLELPLLDCAIAHLLAEPPQLHQLLDQRVLSLLELVLVECPFFAQNLDLHQPLLDARLAARGQLLLGLLLELLSHPDGTAHGRQRKRQQRGEKAHQAASGASSRSAKLYGASGPTGATSTWSPKSAASRRAASRNAS